MAMNRVLPISELVFAFTVGMLAITACHSRTQTIGFGECTHYPADTVPLPPIVVRASADAPGVVLVAAHESHGGALLQSVSLDSIRATFDSARTRFVDVVPGAHRLRVRAMSYRTRDTMITMPRDSGLNVDVPLSHGGLAYCWDGEYERKIPWWKFWDR